MVEARPLPDFRLSVTFTDGTQGEVELRRLIESDQAGVFARLHDPALFTRVHLEYGAVTWPGGIDLAPDAIYDEIRENGKWVV